MLRQQGFVNSEKRGERAYYKLRFRCEGKQVVRYIGGADLAKKVESELAHLQQETKLIRILRSKTKIANRAIRAAKQQLEPILKANGLAFHGLAIRKPRERAKQEDNN